MPQRAPSRRGEGRVAVDLLGYLPEQAVPQLQPYAQLVLVGALFPVAYKGKSVFKVPEGCAVTTLATRSRPRDCARRPGEGGRRAIPARRARGAFGSDAADWRFERKDDCANPLRTPAGERDLDRRRCNQWGTDLRPDRRCAGTRLAESHE